MMTGELCSPVFYALPLHMKLRCGKFLIESDRPLVMGIVNLTPDSFSGDGIASDTDRAIRHAMTQIEAGADMLDIGAESSRPGARPTPLDEELRRLLPVLEALQGCGIPISVDTYKPDVMAAALATGVDMINDITGFRSPEALNIVGKSDCAICIMHMQGEPGTMQENPQYRNVTAEVRDYLAGRVANCREAGIVDERIVLDPGFGFGKTLDHNLALFRNLGDTRFEGMPLLVGVSRKSMIGSITGRPVQERLPGSIVAAALAAQRGADILRVHDVAATQDALAVLAAIEKGESE